MHLFLSYLLFISFIFIIAKHVSVLKYQVKLLESRKLYLLMSDPHLRKKKKIIYSNESPIKMMKNTFYFMLKVLFALEVFNSCPDFLVM